MKQKGLCLLRYYYYYYYYYYYCYYVFLSFKFCTAFACKVELHLSGLTGTATHPDMQKIRIIRFFLISNFRRVLKIVCFLPCNPPASEFYMPTFRNALSRLHRRVSIKILHIYPPMKMEETECSETLANKIQTPGNYPEESIQLDFSLKLGYVGS